ncbi:SDR family NAD(P)-dependent oxidoreductase [Myroides sp. BIT-d1]|uniref:SDR family NAD(P)-dependent oxidoreductase n=1 Tax=Myroides albus TaxID=2562892 RepID=A0A6I3LMQ0_9FLAO|nr:SDR family oxidoreductase [Myroides albus]MTG98766.1 SDR family NAD(P)-dependent oxidoreductase [Myroides albus]
MKHKRFLVYGVSKGLGNAIINSIPEDDDKVFGVSRSKPLQTKGDFVWIPADLSKPEEAVLKIKETIHDTTLDCIIYNVGIWEQTAFSEEYDFEGCSFKEIDSIVQTNITACIMGLQAFIANLRLSSNAKIILIGSTWGLENHKGSEVAFSATKFALRGIVHSLRESLRKDKIGITILNLGYLATEFDISVPTEEVIEETQGALIPLFDVISAIKFVLSTTNASCVKEITIPAMLDENV